jgi:serine/threonine-protein kinase
MAEGERIGRYEVLSRINAGGMGSVYLARDPHLNRRVAVKLLLDTLDTDDWRRRFQREGKALARLAHPNIVTVFDFGEDDRGRPFIVMEYVEGHHLGELMVGPFPLLEKLRYLEQLCDGLDSVHRAGITHLDIKPANLIVEPGGRLKIVDFGVSRAVDPRGTFATVPSVQAGTPSYMAPEAFTGGPVGPAADQFAAGAVAYELLSGRRAFDGSLREVAMKICAVDPPPPSQVQPGLDRALDIVVMRALHKEAASRFASMADMGRSIARIRERLDSRNLATLPAGVADVGTGDVDTISNPLPPVASQGARTGGARPETGPPIFTSIDRDEDRREPRRVGPLVWVVGGAVAATLVWFTMLAPSREAPPVTPARADAPAPTAESSTPQAPTAPRASAPGRSAGTGATPPDARPATDPREQREVERVTRLMADGSRDALPALESALARYPGNPSLGGLLSQMQRDAREAAGRQRQVAARAAGTPGFEQASEAERDALDLVRRGLYAEAIRKYWDAEDMFVASRDGAVEGDAAIPPSASPAPPPPSRGGDALRRPLAALARGYASLSGAAVKAAYPALTADDVRALDRRFLDYAGYRLDVRDVRSTVNGARASITCVLDSHITMRNGTERRSSIPAVVTLEESGGSWAIVSVSRLP